MTVEASNIEMGILDDAEQKKISADASKAKEEATACTIC